ncbi:MAG: hypothetical protein HYR67_03515 [Bacteroidetes bacterium]|nr:hypothetical protein [Bacteroidota bacterium]
MIKKILAPLFVLTSLLVFKVAGQTIPPSAAPDISNFNLNPDKIGAASHSVNLFTGDLNLPFNLVSISGKEGLDVSVSISYNSNVQNQVDTWNLDAPAGILGLGWNMDMPKIVCDHKGTGTREDDTYYIVDGGGSNRLVRSGSGSDAIGSFNIYQTKKYQFWLIKFYYDPIDYGFSGSGSNKWVIVRENGFKYVYGDKNSGRSTIQYTVRWNNWIGNSSNTTGQTQMASTWNLSEINNLWGEKVTFEYTNVEQYVGSASGQKQTEASYLKQIVDPIGRKVQFFYNNKSAQFYMEPHTEQAEPDAYQEVYEKQYLDHIDVLQETGNKYLSVNFRYTTINDGGNTAKMLLSYIEKRNGAGRAMPGIHFDYFTATGTTGFKGFLQKITYPAGGTVSYNYSMTNNVLGHSNRNLNIPARPADFDGPYGYAEPLMWFGSDYVVVTWRALGSGGSHLTGPANVKLYVYQWVGEWKEQFLQTIGNVSATFTGKDSNNNTITLDASHYVDFQVVIEENFFAVLSHPVGDTYQLFIRYKDESTRGKWLDNSSSIDYGAGIPTLMSGDNFIAVGSFQDDSTHPCHLYTFQGNNWNDVQLNQTIGDHYYCSANNYFISHNRAGFDGYPEINFTYLSEDKNWITKPWGSWLEFSSSSQSYWYGSNSFAVAMAGNNPEFIYRWDLSYTNFFRDNGGSSILGIWDDHSWVFNVDNSMIGLADYQIKGLSARFDGNNWITSSTYNTNRSYLITYGVDFALYVGSNWSTKYISTFNPNVGAWYSPVSSSEGSGVHVMTTGNYYSNSGSNYYRMPNGNWTPIMSSPGILGNSYLFGGGIYFFKNGSFSSKTNTIDPPTNFFQYSDKDQFNNWITRYLVGPNTVANYTVGGGLVNITIKDAKSLNLYRVVGEDIKGQQVDYPVNSITISGANSIDQSVAFEYNFSTATVDPSGSVAQYAEVNVIPGSNVASSKPNGFTKTFFNNGLDHYWDDSNIPAISGVSIDLRWLGQPYFAKAYDANSNIISTYTTFYAVTSKPINNSANTKVDVGYYVRPSSINRNADGIEVITSYTYDLNSGLVRTERKGNSFGTQIPEESDYLYWYEKYDPTQSQHLLTPVAQVTNLVNNSITGALVTRYKNWSALNLGGSATAPGVFDQLVWKGTNSSAFTSWDATIASGSLTDWSLAQQISVRDNYTGAPLETLAKGNIFSAVILDQYKIRSLAKVVNANFSQVAFTSFEDNSKGNWSWTDGTITNGTGKTGNNYMNIGTTGISTSGLSSSEKYTLSFWAKSTSGLLNLDGVGAINLGTLSTWAYQEYTVTGLSSLSLKLTSGSASIDELRLYPTRASMTTSTYDLVYGPTSQTDNNSRVVYTQYDAWGRALNIVDENLNIIKSYIYNTKN